MLATSWIISGGNKAAAQGAQKCHRDGVSQSQFSYRSVSCSRWTRDNSNHRKSCNTLTMSVTYFLTFFSILSFLTASSRGPLVIVLIRLKWKQFCVEILCLKNCQEMFKEFRFAAYVRLLMFAENWKQYNIVSNSCLS